MKYSKNLIVLSMANTLTLLTLLSAEVQVPEGLNTLKTAFTAGNSFEVLKLMAGNFTND